jgi:hypothetical protein
MQPSGDHPPSHPYRAMTNGVTRVPHPTVVSADSHRTPDRIADLVTCIVNLLVELYRQPTSDAPYAAADDPRLHAAITRLQGLEGSFEQLPEETRSVHRLAPTIPAPDCGDRGEWVSAGMPR